MSELEILEPRSGFLSGELPCGAVVDGELRTDFLVHEMDGDDEDLLMGKGPIVTRFNKIITNCSESLCGVSDKVAIGPMVHGLTAADRMVLLVAVRRAGCGDIYEMVGVKCPECGHRARYRVNLADLEIKKMPNPTLLKRTDTLVTGIVVDWHIMSGLDEEWMQRKIKLLKGEKQLTVALAARVDKVDDVAIDREGDFKGAMDALRRMKSRERNNLRTLFEIEEGSIDLKLEFVCSGCEAPFSGQLAVAQKNFFFPAEMSNS